MFYLYTELLKNIPLVRKSVLGLVLDLDTVGQVFREVHSVGIKLGVGVG